MATSEHWQIPWVVELMARERPASVLDVGAGWGKFGVLAREYSSPQRVDALDVSPPRYPVYDHVFLGDMRELDRLIPPETPRYDLALVVEVLEHLEKAEGWSVLERLARRARKVLVATPWGFRPQEAPGLPFEIHRSGWYPWEFRRRFRVHEWRVYPGHFTRWLKLPRLWQFTVLLSSRSHPGPGGPASAANPGSASDP
jgi:hypothetical protein